MDSHGALNSPVFVNGIPVATLEIKNLLTGSTFRHAERQYRADRPPAGEPLLTFRRGALVHFALDEDNVSMTTRLQNGKTRFLPFNRGHEGGAGNPDIRTNSASPISMRISPRARPSFAGEVASRHHWPLRAPGERRRRQGDADLPALSSA